MLTLRHDCTSLECFMAGVMLAVRKVGSLKETSWGWRTYLTEARAEEATS